jgi:hypothetical protein
MSNGYPKGQDTQRNGLQPAVNQTQAPATQYVQSNSYAPETYKTVPTGSVPGNESVQGVVAGSASSVPHPPLVYTGPWQYPQINHTGPEAGFQATSNHRGHGYGSNAMDYHEDASQLPHMSPSMLAPGNFMAYQPHGPDQHADILPLSAWDDSIAAAPWPNSIMIMPQQHQQQQPQPQQQQQYEQQQQ